MAGPFDPGNTYGFSFGFGGAPLPRRGPTWEPGMPWPFVHSIIDRDEVASTNDLAMATTQSGWSAYPLLVRARSQTGGRGRGENTWWSDSGSLTFTLVLDPAAHGLTDRHQPRLALAAAVAVIEAVADYVLPTKPLGLRWPNDVEVGGRKLGGILPERVSTPHGPHLLLGIGVNVLTRLEKAPPDVRRIAASLADDAPSVDDCPTPDRVLAAVLAGLESVLPRLSREDPLLAEHWASLDLLRGRPVRIDLGTRIVSGVGAGIDHEGALLVAPDDGSRTLRLFGGRVLRDS
jgi:BirA family biotin operon repressor/biotin-[acetyl-CoA-carboxylase] ligase